MITKPVPNVWMVENYSNAYLVEFKEHLIIIDAGMDKKAKELIEAIEKTGKEPKAVLITHGHLDHINGLAKLKEKYPHIEVVSSEEDKAAIEGKEFLLPKGVKGFFYRLMMPLMRYRGVKVNKTFKADYARFRVIKTPGHTKGSVSFLLTGKDKILFCGDLLVNPGRLSTAPEEFNLDKKQLIESIRKISKIEFDCLLSGHGEVVKEARQKVEQFLASIQG